MATSGTAIFNPEIAIIVEDAFLIAGRPMRSGYDLSLAARCFNLLTQELTNRGLNFWTVVERTIPLVSGTGTYTLPADTVDILEASFRQNPGLSDQVDYNLYRISQVMWSQIPDKLAEATPTQYFVSRSIVPTVTFYPVPNDSTTEFVYWCIRRMEDAGVASNNVDLPSRFYPVVTSGLAYYLALRIPELRENVQGCRTEFERQFDHASGEDRDRASSHFVPQFYP